MATLAYADFIYVSCTMVVIYIGIKKNANVSINIWICLENIVNLYSNLKMDRKWNVFDILNSRRCETKS